MALLKLPGRGGRKRKGSGGKRAPRLQRDVLVSIPLHNRPASENVCEICGTLKKGTTENKILLGYVCRDKVCRTKAKELTKKIKAELKEQAHQERLEVQASYRDKQREDMDFDRFRPKEKPQGTETE